MCFSESILSNYVAILFSANDSYLYHENNVIINVGWSEKNAVVLSTSYMYCKMEVTGYPAAIKQIFLLLNWGGFGCFCVVFQLVLECKDGRLYSKDWDHLYKEDIKCIRKDIKDMKTDVRTDMWKFNEKLSKFNEKLSDMVAFKAATDSRLSTIILLMIALFATVLANTLWPEPTRPESLRPELTKPESTKPWERWSHHTKGWGANAAWAITHHLS